MVKCLSDPLMSVGLECHNLELESSKHDTNSFKRIQKGARKSQGRQPNIYLGQISRSHNQRIDKYIEGQSLLRIPHHGFCREVLPHQPLRK